jgi:hypothetical protein
MAEKLSYTVPQKVRDNAKRGLKLREETGGKGGLSTQQAGKLRIGSGVARATSLINGNVTYGTIKRMYSFFSRHRIYKERGYHKDRKSKAYISWLLWGGDAGYSWVKRVIREHESSSEKGLFLSIVLQSL